MAPPLKPLWTQDILQFAQLSRDSTSGNSRPITGYKLFVLTHLDMCAIASDQTGSVDTAMLP